MFLVADCGDDSSEEAGEPQASELEEVGRHVASGAYPLAIVTSKDVDEPEAFEVRLTSKPEHPVTGTITLSCRRGSRTDAQKIDLSDAGSQVKQLTPRLEDAESCYAIAEASYDTIDPNLEGRIELRVLAR